MGWKFRPKRRNPNMIEISCRIPEGSMKKLEKIASREMPLKTRVRAFKKAGASETRVSRIARWSQGQARATVQGRYLRFIQKRGN
jgi:hypothetical protein